MSQDRITPFLMSGEDDGDTGVAVQTKTRTKRPPMYKVLLLNDDFTPMEFVVMILERFFGMNHAQAFELMLIDGRANDAVRLPGRRRGEFPHFHPVLFYGGTELDHLFAPEQQREDETKLYLVRFLGIVQTGEELVDRLTVERLNLL